MIRAYMAKASGNSDKLRILLALLKVPHEEVNLDFAGKEHKGAAYLAVNPRGEVPAIDDAGTVVWDSAACLVYVARKFGGEAWLPTDAAGLAEVMQWLALSATELQCGLQYARRGVRQGRWTLGTAETAPAFGRVGLDVMETRLRAHAWLALGRPTIADVACHPYVALAPEGNVPLDPYPAVRAWLARCSALPGWPK